MSRTTRRLSSAIAAALAIGALAAPAANAVTGEEFQASPGPNSSSAIDSSSTPAPTVTRTVDDGFDLGSAAIGAGSAAAVLLLGGAGATAVTRHRRRVRLAG
jgi:hypothetical protein